MEVDSLRMIGGRVGDSGNWVMKVNHFKTLKLKLEIRNWKSGSNYRNIMSDHMGQLSKKPLSEISPNPRGGFPKSIS
jgi:hypothetical protein